MGQSRYIIVPVVDVTEEMTTATNQEWAHMRRSSDGTLAILKYPDGPKPNVFSSYDSYSQEEILTIINTPAWS